MDHRKAFEQAERLSAIVYLNSLVIHKDSPTLGSAIEKMRETEKDWPCRMDRLDWLKVMDGIQGDEALKALRIIKVEDIEATQPGLVRNGHRAVLLGDNSGRGYVIFRGTGSDEEWDDNAKGMLEAETLQQQAAARFVQQICGQFKHITVAGHSKGGNKAQYATITLPETCIDCCFSFDGQGFSMAFWGKYRDAIEKRKPIIHLASERRGFVHALGFPVKETRYHIGRRGDPQKNLPHGYPLSYFHSPDALRDAAGDIGPESADNLIPATLNKLVTHFLETPKYSPHWEKTASGLTSLMSQTKRAEESASAIAQLLMVFVDLIASDVSFRRQVTEMVLKETDVLLASMDAARAAYSPVWPGALHDMGKKTAHHLAHLLAADR
ncbi:MAG: DUF2974 domain-containing protein, partial [Defluviitaleaceae bacterium]|nr:DUF2974 domain-containing protein [Defluviitaleaceae bacterium]